MLLKGPSPRNICRAMAAAFLRDANKVKYVSLARSLNALWTKAGILYAPPIR